MIFISYDEIRLFSSVDNDWQCRHCFPCITLRSVIGQCAINQVELRACVFARFVPVYSNTDWFRWQPASVITYCNFSPNKRLIVMRLNKQKQSKKERKEKQQIQKCKRLINKMELSVEELDIPAHSKRNWNWISYAWYLDDLTDSLLSWEDTANACNWPV